MQPREAQVSNAQRNHINLMLSIRFESSSFDSYRFESSILIKLILIFSQVLPPPSPTNVLPSPYFWRSHPTVTRIVKSRVYINDKVVTYSNSDHLFTAGGSGRAWTGGEVRGLMYIVDYAPRGGFEVWAVLNIPVSLIPLTRTLIWIFRYDLILEGGVRMSTFQ